MLKLDFQPTNREQLDVLCLGAHSDDIEIGCGGTILRLLSGDRRVNVHWVVLAARAEREREARASAERFLAGAGQRRVAVRDFPDSFFPYHGAEIKAYFEELKKLPTPDLILTHSRHDLHQDHRLICELTWNTFRDHLILEYEIIKYDGDLGAPNFYVPLSREQARQKVANILEVFRSQAVRAWFTEDAFMSIMRIRGLESNALSGLAEGFYCRKAVL